MSNISDYIEQVEELEVLRMELNLLKKERDKLYQAFKGIDMELIKIEAAIQEKERELGS